MKKKKGMNEAWTSDMLPSWVHKYFGNRYQINTKNPFKLIVNWIGTSVWNGVAKYQCIKMFGWEAW